MESKSESDSNRFRDWIQSRESELKGVVTLSLLKSESKMFTSRRRSQELELYFSIFGVRVGVGWVQGSESEGVMFFLIAGIRIETV